MAKAASKVRTAKVYDQAYEETTKVNNVDIRSFDSVLQDIATSVLKDKIQQFRSDFVNQTAEAMGVRFQDAILPQGTRFMRQGNRAAAFVIEVPPAIRTINFQDNAITADNGLWSLAFPYLYFIPIFGDKDNRHVLSAMCLACRTKPLESPDDMLHCINLPNSYRIYDLPKKELEDGNIPGMKEMAICQGWIGTGRSTDFSPKNADFNSMIHETILHFWSSRFNHELDFMYTHMTQEDARFKDIKTWQENSIKDPLFVLDVKYPKAIRLNKLFNDIMYHHDSDESVIGQINDYTKRIHDEVWAGIQTDSKYKNIKMDLSGLLLAKLNETLQKFSSKLSMNLSSIDNPVMKQHILFSIKNALQEAVR